MPVLSSAGSLLREARHRAGLTQAEVARRAGVTQSVVSAYESGSRQPSVPALLKLLSATGHSLDASLVRVLSDEALPMSGRLGRRVRLKQQEIKAVANSYGIRDVRVFGSVARGDERPDSDVDLLVDLPDTVGLFTLGRLRQELEDLVGAPIDLVPTSGLKPGVRASLAADLVVL